MAQFIYNSSPMATGISPFYTNYRLELVAFRNPKNIKSLSQRALMNIDLIKNLYKKLSRDIKFITIKSSLYYNSKRVKRSTLKEGDPIYLL
jgi:hypothetical protein